MPDDSKTGTVHSSSEGGTVGKYPDPDPAEYFVAPSTSSEFNKISFNLYLIAYACVSDIRFKFDSSFVLPEIQKEMKALSSFRKNDPLLKEAPISIFGHADPSYQGNFDPKNSATAGPGDNYNKTLSGRRAIAIYAMLIRDPSFWDRLFTNHLGTDVWGDDSIRTMLDTTGQPSSDDTTVANIASNSGQRRQLFLAYMEAVCGDLKLDKSADFVARGAGPDLKGDVQGCSRFNPLMLFSSEDEAHFKQAFTEKDEAVLRDERDPANAVNRRVMILMFKKGTQVLPAKWPCPTYLEGPAGCKKRFFVKDATGPDGDTRRSTHDPGAERKFEVTHDTFACRFYQRISGEKSPCNSTSPPLTCNYTILGPANVPGLSKYKYKIDVPAGKEASEISWAVDKPTAGFEGSTEQAEVVVTFQNSKADWVTLRASFTLDGFRACAEKQIALVRVEVGAPTFTNPGKVSADIASTGSFLVNPPAPPAVPTWVTTNDPGSTVGAFTFNGTQQPDEPARFVDSNGGGGGASFSAVTTIKLTSPPEKPDALQRIEVGYIQNGTPSGSATYGAGLTRTIRTATPVTVDWLSNPPQGGDKWPWYDTSAMATGSGNNTWSTTLSMRDSPKIPIPAQFKPTVPADPHSAAALVFGNETLAFDVCIAARTRDDDLGANKHYFDESHSTWSANFVFPVIPGISIVTVGASWTVPPGPSEVSVNVLPTIKDILIPFLRWEY
jgi:hypothetical protein